MTISGRKIRKPRTTVHIEPKLENRLLAYVTAAGAAGVGLAAIAQPVEAKIVYTPLSNVQLYNLTTVDINGDGVPDLSFKFYSTNYGADQFVYPGAGGALVFGSLNNVYGPFPNPWLTRIGPKSKFSTERGLINGVAGCHSTCENFGLWVKQTDHYLGIKFLIAGQTHYGWMRITEGTGIGAYASGYAYEDIANKPILAGPTSGPVVAPAAAPNTFPRKRLQTLGMLALGADGISIWRREKEEVRS
jgi:hypothetical protein